MEEIIEELKKGIGFSVIPTITLAELEFKYPKEVYKAAVDGGRKLNEVIKNFLKPEILQKLEVDIKMPCDDEEFLDYFNQMFCTIFGFEGGAVEIFKDEKGDIVGKRAVIRNNKIPKVILERYGKQKKPTCQWIRGIAGGSIAESRSWEKFSCEEIKCVASGDEYCEFIIKRVD